MRRHTGEQDKALDTIHDALGDLQRMGEVSTACLCCAWRCCPGGGLTLEACQHAASNFKRASCIASSALAEHSRLVSPCTQGSEGPAEGSLPRQAMPQTSSAHGSAHRRAAGARTLFAHTLSATCRPCIQKSSTRMASLTEWTTRQVKQGLGCRISRRLPGLTTGLDLAATGGDEADVVYHKNPCYSEPVVFHSCPLLM